MFEWRNSGSRQWLRMHGNDMIAVKRRKAKHGNHASIAGMTIAMENHGAGAKTAPAASISVACLDTSCWPRAQSIAASMALPCVLLQAGTWRTFPGTSLLLLVDGEGLWLATTGTGRTRPVRVDFFDTALWRRIHERVAW